MNNLEYRNLKNSDSRERARERSDRAPILEYRNLKNSDSRERARERSDRAPILKTRKLTYNRVLLKLSGKLFANADGRGISFPAFEKIAKSIAKIKKESNVQLAIVLGGGNILRGREVSGEDFDDVTADNMGMLGTVINGLAFREILEKFGVTARMMTASRMEPIAEFYIRKKALHYLEQGKVVIFTGGTGNPFFTTDSAAVLRACEMKCDLILKATGVDGIYDKDPKKYKNEATLYKEITYREALEKNLEVMDNTAFALSWKKKIPIIVFNEKYLDNVSDILRGEKIGTFVS